MATTGTQCRTAGGAAAAGASVWDRLAASSPVVRNASGGTASGNHPHDEGNVARTLGDSLRGKRNAIPADVRAQAERKATAQWIPVYVFRTRSGGYVGVSEDDRANLAKYIRTATILGFVEPKLPSLRVLVAAIPRAIREQVKRAASRSGVAVVLFLERNGNYVGVTTDDTESLAKYRARRTARELVTIEPEEKAAPARTKTATVQPARATKKAAQRRRTTSRDTKTPVAKRPAESSSKPSGGQTRAAAPPATAPPARPRTAQTTAATTTKTQAPTKRSTTQAKPAGAARRAQEPKPVHEGTAIEPADDENVVVSEEDLDKAQAGINDIKAILLEAIRSKAQ